MSIDLNGIIAWLTENWIWPAAIIGAIVLFFIIVSLLPDAKIRTSAEFPTTGDEARDLAIGAIQITTAMGAWNDPTAKHLTESKTLRRNLSSMWGLDSRSEWAETLAELPERRREPLRDGLLELRARLAAQTGKRPSKREWVQAAKAEGATGRQVTTVIDNIVGIEAGLRKKALGTQVLPDSATIASADAYALGQVAALATWGVALGFATREEIRPILADVSSRAKAQFGSWEEFGRSYLLGRALRNVENGLPLEKAVEANQDGITAYGQALDVKRDGGPWSSLAW